MPFRPLSRSSVVRVLGGLGLFRSTLFVFLGTLLLGLTITFVVRPMLGRDKPLGGEGYDGYIELARNLAAGHGYVLTPGEHKVFHRPPLYPVLLVPGALLPEPLCRVYVSVLNSALFALLAATTFALARCVVNVRVAWLAFALLALNPFMLASSKNPVSGICQTLAFVLVLYSFRRLYERASGGERISRRLIAACVGAAGAGIMVHGTMLADVSLILGLLACWAVWHKRWQVLGVTSLIAVLLVLLVMPWAWRNYEVTGMRIPVAGNSGLAYFAGNAHWGITLPAERPDEQWHESELRHIGLPADKPRETVQFYGFARPEDERFANARMKEHVKEHPLDFAKKVILNGAEYYLPVLSALIPPNREVKPSSAITATGIGERLRGAVAMRQQLLQSLFNIIAVMLAWAGLWTLARNRRTRAGAAFLGIAWAAYALPYFPFLAFVPDGIYTFGTMPVLAILGAAFLMRRDIQQTTA